MCVCARGWLGSTEGKVASQSSVRLFRVDQRGHRTWSRHLRGMSPVRVQLDPSGVSRKPVVGSCGLMWAFPRPHVGSVWDSVGDPQPNTPRCNSPADASQTSSCMKRGLHLNANPSWVWADVVEDRRERAQVSSGLGRARSRPPDSHVGLPGSSLSARGPSQQHMGYYQRRSVVGLSRARGWSGVS